jgi:surface protein
MFNGCSLTSLDISGWDTSKVTTMFSMFFNCYALQYVTGFGTRNYTSIINTGSVGFKGVFAQSGLSVNGYNQILIDLSNNVNLPLIPVQFGAVGVKYSSAAITARAYLTGIKGWTINDDGLF